jgi:hypothetical protein
MLAVPEASGERTRPRVQISGVPLENRVRRDAEHHTRGRVCSPDLSPPQPFSTIPLEVRERRPGAMACPAVAAQSLFLVDRPFGKILVRTALV